MRYVNELMSRTNVMRRSYKGKDVFIYDDHRWVLNVLFALYKDGIRRPSFVFFDAHDDAAQTEKKSILLEKVGVKSLDEATPKQFGAFVDYDLRIDDSNWLLTAAELGLIGDAVVIGNRYNDSIEELNGIYTTEDGEEHKFFELSEDLGHELGCRGSLGDRCKEQEYKDIREFFKIDNSGAWPQIGEITPLVLDFDLDCFTLDINNGPNIPWQNRTFHNKIFGSNESNFFVRNLMRQASVITICREPDYCGCIGDYNVILQKVDHFFFDGELGTSPSM